MTANRMSVEEFKNIMADNHYDDDDVDIKTTGDCFVDGLKIMGNYLDEVNVRFIEDGVVWTERVERLLAHNISYDDVKRLHALGWYVEYEHGVMVAFQLSTGDE
jgi:hypothetical protein